jgi:hypothetical protein
MWWITWQKQLEVYRVKNVNKYFYFPAPSLGKIISNYDILDEIAKDPEAQKDLMEHLPEGQQNAESLKANLHSPQLI